MFNITTKSDYGFIIMLELAKKYQKGHISLAQIANDKKLSAGYLMQIIQPLVKAGLVESKEGKGGGFALKKDPKKTSVLEILQTLEGPIRLVKCLKDDSQCCEGFNVCEAKKVWPIIVKDVQNALAQRTLFDLVKKIK
ncbi:transcriptional regulator [Candidatus Falkowbacteria bacterium CG10_big_fil_rev_8_21_14_0_10_37_6]|uniref:Transcriptional regulator n=1 Tax=Candidatus Falkowbacteria bacterium CG10_big_fil_rev_8_21_14_0_10_37_6 TaxID=1974563 RepID=A0A2H0V7K5_9BACT|nr:MAG: transcriptional regulator [Candidatus Falkowbacteria bacterium CG10_big_fil_rev_8_21_14_0_10_37_6]